jgi:hypothetical protein
MENVGSSTGHICTKWLTDKVTFSAFFWQFPRVWEGAVNSNSDYNLFI